MKFSPVVPSNDDETIAASQLYVDEGQKMARREGNPRRDCEAFNLCRGAGAASMISFRDIHGAPCSGTTSGILP